MSDIANGDFPEATTQQEAYLQDVINSQLGKSVDTDVYPKPTTKKEAYMQAIIKNQQSSSGGASLTAVNLVIDSVGLITGGTGILSDGSSIPITVTAEGDIITQAEINSGLDAIIESEDSYIGE